MPLKALLKVSLKAPLKVSPPIVHPILCCRRGPSGHPPPGAPQNGVLNLLKGRLKGYLKGSGGAPSMKVKRRSCKGIKKPSAILGGGGLTLFAGEKNRAELKVTDLR